MLPFRCFFASAALLLSPSGAAADGAIDPAVDAARRGDFELTVLGPDGPPLAGRMVEVELERHEFLFGCNLYVFERLGDPARDEAYKRAFREVFNYATLPFYWKSYERRRGAPDHASTERMLEWCAAQGITAKGHPLIWTHPAGLPEWIKTAAPEEARALAEARVRETVTRFRGRMAFWDVVNEATHTRPFAGFTDALEVVAASHRLAREADVAARLVLNEYHVISEKLDLVPFARRCIEAGVPVDAIGIQAHEPRAAFFEPERIRAVLDRHAALGREIHLTEVTFPSGGQRAKRRGASGAWETADEVCDEAWQAKALEALYRAAFAHPAVSAITWWDLADARSWLPGGGLLREDLTPKPAWELLRRLVREEWHTKVRLRAGADGRVRFRGFFGAYNVRTPGSPEAAPGRIDLLRRGPRAVSVGHGAR